MEKKKIQVGVTCYFDKKGNETKSVPIKDWINLSYKTIIKNFYLSFF